MRNSNGWHLHHYFNDHYVKLLIFLYKIPWAVTEFRLPTRLFIGSFFGAICLSVHLVHLFVLQNSRGKVELEIFLYHNHTRHVVYIVSIRPLAVSRPNYPSHLLCRIDIFLVFFYYSNFIYIRYTSSLSTYFTDLSILQPLAS